MGAIRGDFLHGRADLRHGARAVRALTTTWARSRPRRRKSGAGPSASDRPRRTAVAAASAAPGASDEQTTRMSVEKGG